MIWVNVISILLILKVNNIIIITESYIWKVRLRAIMFTIIVLLVSDCISLFFYVCLILIGTVSAYYSDLPIFKNNPLIAKS